MIQKCLKMCVCVGNRKGCLPVLFLCVKNKIDTSVDNNIVVVASDNSSIVADASISSSVKIKKAHK
ncbi:hypothetical protein D5E78_06905 [Vibrio parahaemolyticus]|nr:hypothetical protein D5E78_06905 [Vibrio parahaemolyticus]